MRRPRWEEREGSAFHPTDRTTLAYVAPSGDVSLWNDYEAYRTILVRRPTLEPEARALVAHWSAGREGPHPISTGEKVQGYGVFTFPYGPVAMGVAEAGGFDVHTYGERILELEVLVGHKHRAIETAVVGRPVEDAALWVERRAGPFALSHVATFLSAVESAQGRAVAERELWVRALAQELQRIYNHLRVLYRVAEAASQNVGAAQVQLLAEDLLRTIARTFGHRWGFGALLPRGPATRLDRDDRIGLARRLATLQEEFDDLWESFLASRTFIDRLQSTGVIPPAEAVRWGMVGPALRASAIPWDDRLRSPEVPYTDLFLSLATESGGDALARVLVRREEIRSSLLLLEQILDRWSTVGSGEVAPAPPVGVERGLARSEAPSGDVVYDVALDRDRVRAMSVRTPSQANWVAIALSLRGAVFTDFSFALESFGSSFAESDG